MKTTGNVHSKTKYGGDERTQSSGEPPVPVPRLPHGRSQDPFIPKQTQPKFLSLEQDYSWQMITTALLELQH